MRFPIALLGIAFLGALGASALAADTMAASPTVVPAASIKWMDGTGALKGAKVAVLMGDPTKAGPFVMRVKVPNGVTFPSHYHPVVENVTVISGTFIVGTGDKVDMKKAMTLPAGSWASIPANVHHWGTTKGETVLQLDAVGPWEMDMVKGKM